MEDETSENEKIDVLKTKLTEHLVTFLYKASEQLTMQVEPASAHDAKMLKRLAGKHDKCVKSPSGEQGARQLEFKELIKIVNEIYTAILVPQNVRWRNTSLKAADVQTLKQRDCLWAPRRNV